MSPPGASLPGAAPVATPSSVTPSSAPKMDVFLNRAREKLRKAVKSNKKMAPSRPSDVIDDVNATRQRLSILDALDAQRRQQQFVDLTLKCAETSFPVHRSVMAAASPFFRAMLSVEMRESGQDVIELKDMDADAMEAVIDYIYTGQLRLPSWSLLLQLLLLGNMMQIEMLEKECTDLVEELMHELHRWIFAEAPPRTSMSADEDLQVCLNREDELRDAALGRDSLEFLLEVMYMFEEYPVVMNREDEVKRYGNQPANDKIPVAKARRNLCFKILRSPRVLEALAERHSDILNKFDTKMLEYLVKCPGVFYGFPDQIVLILSKKLLHEVGNEAESDDLESASDAIQMLLDWFLNLLLLMPKKCRDTNFMSRIFVKLFPEAGLSPETDFDVIDLTFRGQGHQVVNPSKDHGHHLLQLTFQTVLEHSGETPLLCQWSNDSLRMRISELDRGDEFVIHPPEKKEMIQMESSMRLWSGCYKTWLEVEEMSPTQVIHVEANQGSLSQVQGSLSPEAAQTDFVGAFEILKVFLAALHDGRTKEVKVFICGYDPISDSWISVGDDATVMYQNEDAETEAQTEITEVFAGASSDGKKIYIAVNSQTKGEKQRATYHMLSYEMASSSNLFKYVLMNKHVKRRNHVSAMTVTSGPRGDEVIIFGHAYSGALRIASTHSLLYWEANVPLERIKRPIPDHGDSASSGNGGSHGQADHVGGWRC